MKVRISQVGVVDKRVVEWPNDWPVPREGEQIELEEGTRYVRHVIWYPEGDHEERSLAHKPFVYVVIGPNPVKTHP